VVETASSRHLLSSSVTCWSLASTAATHGAGDGEQPEDVGLEHGLDFFGAGFLDGAEEAASGVVDEDVDAAEPARRCLRDGGRLGRVGDVKRDGEEAVAVTGQRLGHPLRLPGGRYDRVASVKGLPGDLPAEAAGRSGDEPNVHDRSVSLKFRA
jgi:hypothetical protein